FALVRLVADHFEMIRDSLAAELHSAVHKSLGAHELEFQAEVEVFVALLRGEKFIVRYLLRERAADERAIHDAPRFFRVALPAFEGFAIEKRYRCGMGEHTECEGRKQCREEGFHVGAEHDTPQTTWRDFALQKGMSLFYRQRRQNFIRVAADDDAHRKIILFISAKLSL